MKRIREEFEREYGEPGYSVNEFRDAIASLGRRTALDTVRRYVSEQGLAVDLRKMEGLDLAGNKAKYLIPSSNLGTLMESMSVNATLEELIEKLESQRKRASSNVNRMGKRGPYRVRR